MSDGPLERTGRLIGEEGIRKLQKARVLLFGLGGVGGYAAESLLRSGIGHLTIVDKDKVDETNLNRQLIATRDTLGRPKAEVMKERFASIRPEAEVEAKVCFFLPETAQEFSFASYDYVIDAVDTVTAKIAIISQAVAAGAPVISCMGAGNKLHPELFQVADLSETSICPLARVMRRELKQRGILHCKVVYSKEKPVPSLGEKEEKDPVIGSTAFAPGVAGLLIGSTVFTDLLRG